MFGLYGGQYGDNNQLRVNLEERIRPFWFLYGGPIPMGILILCGFANSLANLSSQWQ